MAPKHTAPENNPYKPRDPKPAGSVHSGAAPAPARPTSAPVAAAPAAVAAAEPIAAAPGAASAIHLPLSVMLRSDISRSLREVQGLEDYFRQAGIRGSKDQTLPALSRVLDSFAKENNLNLLHVEDRLAARKFLEDVKTHGPVVHVSFAAEPGGDFLTRLLDWFRREAHPYVLLHVGLQPELAAGCMIRTTNRMFDFSFRARFEASKAKLIAAIIALGDVDSTTAPDIAAAQGRPVAAVAASQPPAVPVAEGTTS